MTVLAQIFPVDAGNLALATSMKSDLVLWGLALIGVGLVSYAYLKILDLARERGEREGVEIFNSRNDMSKWH